MITITKSFAIFNSFCGLIFSSKKTDYNGWLKAGVLNRRDLIGGFFTRTNNVFKTYKQQINHE
jgi:hypothetical protein